MDVDSALLHIDADVGRRVRRRTNTERKRSDAETEVKTIIAAYELVHSRVVVCRRSEWAHICLLGYSGAENSHFFHTNQKRICTA